MTDISDLSGARIAKAGQSARALRPRDALVRALSEIDAGQIDPTHIIVVHYDENQTGFFQAGSATNTTVTGMLHRAVHLIWKYVR